MNVPAAGEKPLLRGVLHQFAAVFALGAGSVMVAMAPTARAGAAAGVFAGSLVVLFTISAVYHRVNWIGPGRTWMRRADHASIFLLIAGTYTPIALLGLPSDEGRQLLLLVWSGAVVGILQSLFWVQAPKAVTALIAVAVGWTAFPYFGRVMHALGAGEFALIIAGGAAYTLGALAYATRRPDLRPGVFGYHELFHALTLVGAGLHFAAVLQLLRVTGPVLS